MRLSKNYELKEFEVSAKATAKGWPNSMPVAYRVHAMKLVIHTLQPVNDATGWLNEVISGYRAPRLNTEVGGSATSQHLTAEASDNVFFKRVDGKRVNIPVIEVARKVLELGVPFDQMIIYPTFVHLSYSETRRGGNRRQVLYNKSYLGPRV